MSHLIKTRKVNSTEFFFLVNLKRDNITTDSMKLILSFCNTGSNNQFP